MRAVVDANIVVSRSLSEVGASAVLLRAWRQSSTFELLVSDEILDEYERALRYPRVRRRNGMTDGAVRDLIADFRRFASLVVPQERLAVVKDDPDDDKYVECAVEGDASYIVSGDRHLLALGEYRGIRIVTPREFVTILSGTR